MSNFDWRQYITLSDEFSAREKELLSQSLDSIVNAHDGEGERLIRQIGENRGGQPIHLRPVTTSNTNFPPWLNTMNVNFRQIASSEILDPQTGQYQRNGLTTILVHELFHAADPLVMAFGTTENASVIGELEQNVYNQGERDGLMMRDGKGELSEWQMQEMRNRIAQVGRMTPEGLKVVEERANEFTNEFMRKNFGDQVPMRVTYDTELMRSNPDAPNWTDEEVLDRLLIPELTDTVYATNGYEADLTPETKNLVCPLPMAPSISPVEATTERDRLIHDIKTSNLLPDPVSLDGRNVALDDALKHPGYLQTCITAFNLIQPEVTEYDFTTLLQNLATLKENVSTAPDAQPAPAPAQQLALVN